QIQRTEQIQAHIGNVKNTTAQIEQNVRDTVNKVAAGREQMAALESQVEQSKSANAEVLEKMQELSTYTGQMNTITETISSITNSTAMLALNASIEAARAGEAGKGFAVVAGQISELASQTRSATSNITSLIENINMELTQVVEAVNVVTRSNDANAESTGVVKNTFAGITSGTEDISRRTEELLQIVTELEHANGDIVENIQTISAITEEISAHANETFHACEENINMVESVHGIVENLNDGAKKLQNA
ncbi:MAG: chemotaxis protein, partial [Acetatifactor sp.]|nr:chemotaxis protein [Acetatifactor sp.]